MAKLGYTRGGGEDAMVDHFHWLIQQLRIRDKEFWFNFGPSNNNVRLSDIILTRLEYFIDIELEFLQRTELIHWTQTCHKCNKPMTLHKTDVSSLDNFRWECDKRLPNGTKCTATISIRDGSWFIGSKLSISDCLKLTFAILLGRPGFDIMISLPLDENTVTDWRQFVEECLVEHFVNNSQPIGGNGVVVEIDVSKFGKRKYNRGRQVYGQWVLGGVERGRQGRVFLVPLPNNDRSAIALIPIIQQYVLPGTTIMTDCWGGFNSLGLTYEHFNINHSRNFVDSDTGANTKTKEGLWRHLKEQIPGHNKQPEFFNNRFGRSLFYRHNIRMHSDMLLSFLDIVRRVDWTPEGTTPNNENIVEEEHRLFSNDNLLDLE